MRSSFRFVGSQRRSQSLPDATFQVAGGGLWSGIGTIFGHGDHWTIDDFAPETHFVGFNAGGAPMAWEAKIDGRFRRVSSDPGGLWFCPAGEFFSHRVVMPADVVMVMIQPEQLTRWTGDKPLSLARRYGLVSPQLSHLSGALAQEARQGNPNGALFVDALGQAMAQGLAALLGGTRAAALPALRLQRVLDYIDESLGSDLSVDELAGVACLSPAHFSRAFKAATGFSPHRFVLERRLLRARSLLVAGRAVAETAVALGFFDQSHFTRCFRLRFGVTPGQIKWSAGGRSTRQNGEVVRDKSGFEEAPRQSCPILLSNP